nr:hypothetical protein [Tanacetum cinerariifolium]
MPTLFANPKRQFRARRDTSMAPIRDIYIFYESESSKSKSKDAREIDIETLTLEQYLTLNLINTRIRISNPEDTTFEIKEQFLRELCKSTFLGSSTENVIEHIGKVIEVASLFNINDSALLWGDLCLLLLPMIDTTHARNDVFGKKIFLEVWTKQITFNINERESLAVISPVCVINKFSKIKEFDEPRDLEELLLSDKDLGSFPNDNDILPNLESHDTMFLSPLGSARLNDDSSEMFCNPNSNSSISVDDFVEMDDAWDNVDLRDLTNKATKFPIKPEFFSRNNMVRFARNLHVFIGGHQFLIDFIILENINEFVEKRLIEVLFGQPFEEHVGINDYQVPTVGRQLLRST